MLREIRGIRQHSGEPPRRWFTDDFWDLYVWQNDGDVVAFQLCYGKPDSEHSVTWRREVGFAHHKIDDGESRPGSHRTPILLPDGVFDVRTIADRFRRDSVLIDSKVTQAVVRELGGFPRESNG